MREIIGGDSIDRLAEIEIDKGLVELPPDDQVLNYAFFKMMRDEYNKVKPKYKPSFFEKRFDNKVWDIVQSLYANDSAYFQRIGGCMTVLVRNSDVFVKLDDDYTDVLEDLKTWWNTEDMRERTRPWIAWVFDELIKRYSEKTFVYHMVNHLLVWIRLNAKNWQFHEQFDPENWFGRKSGSMTNALYGGDY